MTPKCTLTDLGDRNRREQWSLGQSAGQDPMQASRAQGRRASQPPSDSLVPTPARSVRAKKEAARGHSSVNSAVRKFWGPIASRMPRAIDLVRILPIQTCRHPAQRICQGVPVTSLLVLRRSEIAACLAQTVTKSTRPRTDQQTDNLHRDDLHNGHRRKDHRIPDIGPLGWRHSRGIHEDGGVSGRA
jgi:hypothetical protein